MRTRMFYSIDLMTFCGSSEPKLTSTVILKRAFDNFSLKYSSYFHKNTNTGRENYLNLYQINSSTPLVTGQLCVPYLGHTEPGIWYSTFYFAWGHWQAKIPSACIMMLLISTNVFCKIMSDQHIFCEVLIAKTIRIVKSVPPTLPA